MKRIFSSSVAVALATLGLVSVPAAAATPAANIDYSMAGTFTDSLGASTLAALPDCSSPAVSDVCNVSESFSSDSNGNFWRWASTQGNGGGAVLDTTSSLGTTFSIYLKFAIDDEANDDQGSNCTNPDANYSKIIDFRDQASDVGLYTSGCGTLYISTGFETGVASIDLGEVVELVLSRDGATGLVSVFINYSDGFEESFVADDSSGDFIPAVQGSGSRIRLFHDDGTDLSWEGIKAGRLYGMKVWGGTALGLDQLDDLASLNNDTLSDTGMDASQFAALTAFGVAAVVAGATVAKRRRRV